MLTDIEIAQQSYMRPISEVAQELGIKDEELELYGRFKAKLAPGLAQRLDKRTDGKLILVTAINPTPAGEGKTTVTVGLGEAMARLNKKAVLALREPSLGPVFGIKGGAAGGGRAQVLPMEDINLHFTGDIHAITAANNLLCAVIDNHMQHGNELGIDPRRINFKRCMDINDRALRNIVIGLGGKFNGTPREDHFIITVASEIMAILCLAQGIEDLKRRLDKILIAYSFDNKPVYARDLGVTGSLAAVLRDALKPNLVQTLENTPVLMHGGPFANIAHGCNSVAATRLALKLGDYCLTEAGFGSDLGAEKFFDIKCRAAGLKPAAAVVVATLRALKYNGGAHRDRLSGENLDALSRGFCNLGAHVENMKKFGLPVVVAINRFSTDTQAEIEAAAKYCASLGVEHSLCEVFTRGGEGGIDLAKKIVEACQKPSHFKPLYSASLPIKEKIEIIAREIYGARGVDFSSAAQKQIKEIEDIGQGGLPVCIAKTQYSLSDDPALLGRPENFRITVRNLSLCSGAGFIVALTGDIMTMPGLPKNPSAKRIDVDAQGIISGLF